MIFFSKSHEWVEVKGVMAIVGITSYAKKELGEIVYAELPKIGQTIHAGQEACILESTKAAADIYSPVSGKVIAVNESVTASLQILNCFPESSGWLFRIELSSPKEIEFLLSKKDYEKLIHNSAGK